MRLKILETISIEKWVWSTTHRNHFHNKMVLAFRYGDDDGDDDERRCWWWDWRFQWWWWWTIVMIQFVFAFGGVGSNYVGIYARCIRIYLCTITTPHKSEPTTGWCEIHCVFFSFLVPSMLCLGLQNCTLSFWSHLAFINKELGFQKSQPSCHISRPLWHDLLINPTW